MRYFGEKGRNVVFSNENLQKIIQRTVVRQNQLKMDIRDAPGQLMDDSHIEAMMRKVGRTKLLPQSSLSLKTNKRVENVHDLSLVLNSVVDNVSRYGLADGLMKADASLIQSDYDSSKQPGYRNY